MTYPTDFRYSREHAWIHVDGDIGVVGITDYARKELGEVVFVNLVEVGAKVEQGKTFGSVESTSAMAQVIAPVSCEVVEVNELVTDAPEKLNEDPHGEAWLVKIRISHASELRYLMTSEQYGEYSQSGEA